jgi:DNA topoisomerase-1
MRKVAHELGNTPAVARASYVSPAVVDHYLAGRTIEDYRARPGSRGRGLAVDEHALLRMLRSRPAG